MLVIGGAYEGGGEPLFGLFTIFGGGECNITCLNHVPGWTEWKRCSLHVVLGRIYICPVVENLQRH